MTRELNRRLSRRKFDNLLEVLELDTLQTCSTLVLLAVFSGLSQGLGGPAYSGAMTEDADAMASFMTDMLGYEIRRDIHFTSGGPKGGLYLTPGARVRFMQIYAPGSNSGYVIVMDSGDDRLPPPAQPRPPSRGFGAWTFSVDNLDDMAKRLTEGGYLVQGPFDVSDSVLGSRRVLTTIAPNGQLIELVEPQADELSFVRAPEVATCNNPVMMVVEGINEDPGVFEVYAEALRDSGIYLTTQGYYAAVGDPKYIFEGQWDEKEFRVFARFPCERRAREFWYSSTYREIAEIREGAGAVRVTVFPELAPPAHVKWEQLDSVRDH